MKKIKLNKGLKLNKESIMKLQEFQLSQLRGGMRDSISCLNGTCNVSCNVGTCNVLKENR